MNMKKEIKDVTNNYLNIVHFTKRDNWQEKNHDVRLWKNTDGILIVREMSNSIFMENCKIKRFLEEYV